MRTWLPYPAFGRWLLLILTAGAIFGPVEAAVADDRQKQILVLYSTRRDAQIAVVGDRELPRMLDEGLPQGLDYYSEYIDRARFPDPEYQQAFGDFLRLKYKGQRFDLIIAMSDLALQFIDKTRSELFRETPIVFFSDSLATRRVANSTGVIAELAFSGTVALAVELQPDIRQIFVVSGTEAGDKVFEREARSQLQSFEPRLTVTYLSGLPTEELESRLATLPDHSMVYFLLVTQDGTGENFQPLAYVDRVTAVASAPTYSWVDSAMDHGIVGGSLKSQEAQTAAVARLALRVLHGERADIIPLSSSDLNVRQVDWRQLRRWGISEARVPAGTIVRFREPSAWARYKAYIVSAAALLLAQAALIGGLLVQRRRRRQVELKLLVSRAEVSRINARLLGAEENERLRIARELHDDIGQRMALLTMELDGLGQVLPLAATDLSIGIRALSNQARELARDIQTASHDLHSSKLDYLGLVAASADVCRGMSEQQNIDIQFSSHGISDHVPADVAFCVFRVLQEAVNNAVKHAGARHVTVALRDGGDEIRLEVVDDGIGFDPDAAMTSPGLGLISMRERLSLVRGDMIIESRPGRGATIRASVPLSRAGGLAAEAMG
jgi:signal transduction histidine kinase